MVYKAHSYDEYKLAMELFKKGLGTTDVLRMLGWPKTRKTTLYFWKYNKHKPAIARWIPEPSSELAYIIGVLIGDGSLYVNRRHYGIRLKVKDLEFAETFSRAMAKTLNKKYVKPKLNKSNMWVVTYSSKAFYTWYVEQTLETLKLFIEYSRKTVASFLKGLYDSEGNYNIYKSHKRKYKRIRLFNNNLKLLKYVQYLLRKYFDIVARGPYINARAGTERKMRNGNIIRTNYDNYLIAIHKKQHVEKFLDKIGFNISRKLELLQRI